MEQENLLGEAPVGRLVLRLALPTMLAQLINILYSVVDRVYVGNIAEVGELALAGVGVCGPIVTMISAFAAWVGFGGGPLMSIRMGRRDADGAKQVVASSFRLLVVLALAVTVPALLFRRQILFAFGASEQLYPYAEPYFLIYVAGSLFALVGLGLNQLIMSQGFAGVAMRAVILGAAMNIILDPILIFGCKMGVRGAALATVFSQVCTCLYTLRFLLGKRAAVPLCPRMWSFQWVRRILRVGVSPALIIALDNIMLIAVNVSLRRYGGAQGDMLIACAAILQSFMLVVTMPLAGITSGTQAILGFNYGSGRTDRVLKAERWIMLLGLVFMGIMFTLARLVPVQFAEIFTHEPEYLNTAAWMIRAYTLALFGLAVQYTVVDGLTAMGIVRWALTFSLVRKTIFLISVFALPAAFGVNALFYAEPVSTALSSSLSLIGFVILFPRLMRAREQESELQHAAEQLAASASMAEEG